MPFDPKEYGPDWREFSWVIRHHRAQLRCECTGQCGLHQANPFTRRCTERHHVKAHYARGIIRLTVAHLCKCKPPCQIPDHVIAACQRCHLRIDRFIHAQHAAETKARKPLQATTPNAPSSADTSRDKRSHHAKEFA